MSKQVRASFISRLFERMRTRKQRPAPSAAPARPFQAISIFRGVRACDMARKFSDHRFLLRDAPQLPMVGCTMPQGCECRYIRHKDRRGEPRRLVDFGTSARVYNGQERRRMKGRRSTDLLTR